jgi:hypothetical protein
MSSVKQSGREREVNEIVTLQRAAEVGRLMLGELRRPMKWIYYDEYHTKPRREIRALKAALRGHLRGEIAKFCQNNFGNVKPADLARLYEPLYARGSMWRLPLIEFAAQLGQPREGVLRGAPLHSTVVLSPWGLQTEDPEMHLVKDLAVAFNSIVAIEDELGEYKNTPWHKAKEEKTKDKIADLQRHAAFHRRMCVLSCFNLAEAYINGLAWEYVQTNDISTLSKRKQKILTEGQASILDKLVKIPEIVTGRTPGPLEKENEPLVTFRETIKPFRDSIVHASPFAAPERFGGYEKLSKIYELNYDTVQQTVKMTLAIIGMVHKFIGGSEELPKWVPKRNDDGTFLIDRY